MWDSAKKPIKIRSVLQSNGMRHFVVNEETDEVYSNILLEQQRRRKGLKAKARTQTNQKTNDSDDNQQQNHYQTGRQQDYGENHSGRHEKVTASMKSSTLNAKKLEVDENEDDFFGVAGNKICDSKHLKAHHNLCKISRQTKDNNLIHLYKDSSVLSKCPHLKLDMLDLIPVKSPVIKKLISGKSNNASAASSKPPYEKGSASSSTLCSRILTWIDLEVKRNSSKGRSTPFSSTDLSIVNELNELVSDSSCNSSFAEGSSGSTSPSEDSVGSSNSTESYTSNNSTPTVSFPKLVPCWKKCNESDSLSGAGNKTKKSVRISEDLPRWGKMKRRLRKQDRSFSLNELDDDEWLQNSTSSGRKKYSSVFNVNVDRHAREKVGNHSLWDSGLCGSTENEERDDFCEENVVTNSNGKVQIHIFLPQTNKNSTVGKITRSCNSGNAETNSNLSGQTDESTS